ncbi:type I-B CRISPR-associated protein Cas5b [Aquifex sp.]
MEVLKFELSSPCATFRVPFSIKGIETYPLPPYSTIIGLIYTCLGRKWEGEKFSVSVQGNFEAIFRDYIRFRKYNKKDKELETLPLQVPRLYKLNCVVHIYSENNELLKEFEEGLKKPKVYPFLGGGEYPVFINNVKILKASVQETEGETEYSAFVPINKKSIFLETAGIHFRIPYFCTRKEGERECEWVDVYYFQRGTLYEGEIILDEEGTPVWI